MWRGEGGSINRCTACGCTIGADAVCSLAVGFMVGRCYCWYFGWVISRLEQKAVLGLDYGLHLV
jgi:hypothetical protein